MLFRGLPALPSPNAAAGHADRLRRIAGSLGTAHGRSAVGANHRPSHFRLVPTPWSTIPIGRPTPAASSASTSTGPSCKQTLFGAARGAPRKKRRGSTTADKHLRWLRAVLRAAQAAGLIASVPKIPFARTGRPNPRPIPPEDLDRIYAACEVATLPQIGGVFPGHWWRAALCVAISCGCRRTALQQLRWENIDLSGRLLWEGSDADKRKQERCKALPAVAVAHLMRVRNTLPGPFWWTGYREGFDRQWHAIQSAAGIPAWPALQVARHQAHLRDRVGPPGGRGPTRCRANWGIPSWPPASITSAWRAR